MVTQLFKKSGLSLQWENQDWFDHANLLFLALAWICVIAIEVFQFESLFVWNSYIIYWWTNLSPKCVEHFLINNHCNEVIPICPCWATSENVIETINQRSLTTNYTKLLCNNAGNQWCWVSANDLNTILKANNIWFFRETTAHDATALTNWEIASHWDGVDISVASCQSH